MASSIARKRYLVIQTRERIDQCENGQAALGLGELQGVFGQIGGNALPQQHLDRIIDIDQEDAETQARELARSEGVFVGVSSGGAVWAARQVCAELERAKSPGVVVCILCDRGDRYLSSPLFSA